MLAPLFDGYRQFYGRAADVAAAESFLRDRFDHAESVIFLAHVAGAPAGFTQLYPSFSSVSLARTFILNDLFVVPGQRRAGVGSALLRAATEHARSLGAIRVTLNTDIENTRRRPSTKREAGSAIASTSSTTSRRRASR